MELKKGDEIIGVGDHNYGVIKIVTEVRENGYSWFYSDLDEENVFVSENSCDPFFDLNWEIIAKG